DEEEEAQCPRDHKGLVCSQSPVRCRGCMASLQSIPGVQPPGDHEGGWSVSKWSREAWPVFRRLRLCWPLRSLVGVALMEKVGEWGKSSVQKR
ncbi:hypothetical protein P7K49_033704, partial [Saguinus oedipus]